jgi:hypothetical protein
MSELTSHTKRLVLVTGAGRSGTSTIAGVFARLGFLVPEPMLKPNESNPRGFYESWWPVKFHTRLIKRAGIEQTDGQPTAAALVRDAISAKARKDLYDWLGEQLTASDMVMVKDPRAAWVPTLWADTTRELGASISYVTMIRHPSEVLGSRSTYYAVNRPSMSPRQFAVWNLCAWINQNLTVERHTRDLTRIYIGYPDLLADWRPVVDRLMTTLSLPRSLLSPTAAAAIDAFIEPSLRRHSADWGSSGLPSALVEIAEETWSALSRLADGHDDHDSRANLDQRAERYAELYADAQAIAQDYTSFRVRRALKQARREGRQQTEQALADRKLTRRLRRSATAVLDRFRRVSGQT